LRLDQSATIVGAGVFGAWIAHTLNVRGWSVTLVEQHSPGNSRSSSGGETRIIRSGYGRIAVYARWARESLPDWLHLERRAQERLFVRTGALFLGGDRAWLADTSDTLRAEGIPAESLSASLLAERFPQLQFPDSEGALLEPEAGVLFSRRAVQALVRDLGGRGVRLEHRRVDPAAEVRDTRADALIFACGPWLPRLFPALLGDAIRPTRQEVLFFGAPAGDRRFDAASLPAWVAFDEGIYGLPDLEGRGVKVALDSHGPEADPDSMDRVVDAGSLARVRDILRRRLPALVDAPLLESRVCQYENTTDGHFLLDRLPGHDRVWIAGGGSGHGFKHGPAVGRYVADLVEGVGVGNPIFALDGRPPRKRAVF
jgi:monomeric sarcosine oxidase